MFDLVPTASKAESFETDAEEAEAVRRLVASISERLSLGIAVKDVVREEVEEVMDFFISTSFLSAEDDPSDSGLLVVQLQKEERTESCS